MKRKRVSDKELRRVLPEADYLEHYIKKIELKQKKGLPLKSSEKCVLCGLEIGHYPSLAAIELFEHLAD